MCVRRRFEAVNMALEIVYDCLMPPATLNVYKNPLYVDQVEHERTVDHDSVLFFLCWVFENSGTGQASGWVRIRVIVESGPRV